LVNPNTKAAFHVGTISLRRLRLTSVFRFPSATTEFITQIAFSPTKNLLAWTDFAGSLYRWSEPVPSSSPSPVASTSTSSLTRPVRRGPTPTLFDDDAVVPTSNQQANEDTGLGGADNFENEDWILDDVGDGLEDDVGAQGDDGHAFVKEMGMEYFTSL
jgi:chromosome transmission fidelity protein 4